MSLALVPGKEWGAERVRTTVKSYIPMTVAFGAILQTPDEISRSLNANVITMAV